jgi:lipid-binding SYLF domain-containing protein
MRRDKRTKLAALVTVLATLVAGAPAFAQVDANELRVKADEAVAQFKQEHSDAAKVLAEAQGILICPQVTKVSFVFGLERGTCVLTRKGSQERTYYNSTGIKWGLTAGMASHVLLLAFNTQDAIDKFVNTKREWEIGVDTNVAVAKAGASGSLDTTNLRAPVVAYIYGEKGLMADISLNGSRYKKIDDIDIIDGSALFRVSALGRLKSTGKEGRIFVTITRWATEAERAALSSTLRDQGMAAMATKAKSMPAFGNVAAPGMKQSVPLRYAYAEKQPNDHWKVILGTTEPLGFVSSWAGTKGAEHDVSVIILDVDGHHTGTGQLFLGTDLKWGDKGPVIDQSNSVTVDLTDVHADS